MSGGGKRVYLAGPDVFLPDAAARGEALRAVCAAHGLAGVFPLDALAGGDAPGWAGLPEALRIARRNEAHIASCDALVANLTPFRGPSADAGTVFELGYMRALGRPVFGWSNAAAPFAARSRAFCGAAAARGADGAWRDGEGMLIEDFPDMADNLMIHGAILASGGVLVAEEVEAAGRWRSLSAFGACIAAVARRLSQG
jgi:nucleoside 2-deoxyribosyltransferase